MKVTFYFKDYDVAEQVFNAIRQMGLKPKIKQVRRQWKVSVECADTVTMNKVLRTAHEIAEKKYPQITNYF